MKTEIYDKALNKGYTLYTHSSGLRVYIFKTPGFSSFYATFGTNYGSIDNQYTINGKTVTVPAGIAHFLEHKMFECEDGDAFLKFAKTGAYSNAYTSFDKTCYIFSCTNNFYENLDILLNFVSKPYFTKETVLKEQGIIDQEITMYDDMPNWRVFHNLLVALYKEHPINIDIPGTTKSIKEITPELLYELYNTFYTPSNMFLALSGDIDEQEVIKLVEKNIDPSLKPKGEAIFKDEPKQAMKPLITQKMEVVTPLYALGFKLDPNLSIKDILATELMVKCLISDASPLFKELMQKNMIDDSFGGEFMYGRGFATVIFEGTYEKPEEIKDAILNEKQRVEKCGIDPVLFDAIKKNSIGSMLRQFNSPDSINNMLVDLALKNEEPFLVLKTLKEITQEDIMLKLKLLTEDVLALSIINK